MKKNWLIIIVLVMILGIGFGLGIRNFRKTGVTADVKSAKVSNTEVSYKGEAGKTALELLQAKHKVEVKKYSFGVMVQGIDGLKADSKNFWGLYVNGKMAETGADSYLTEDNDVIKWKYEILK